MKPKRRARGVFALTVSLCAISGLPSAAAGAAPRIGRYAALGDSYTAMAGVAPIAPSLDDQACSRSERDYPSLIAASLGLGRGSSFFDVSCGGAGTEAVFSPYTPDNPGGPKNVQVPAQLDAVTADTDLVTLSLGGNDDQFFNTLLGTCLRLGAQQPDGNPCQRDGGAQSEILTPHGLDTVFADITAGNSAAVRAIRRKAPRARVFVAGYPAIFPESAVCADAGPIASGDLPWINALFQRLNDALAAAAEAEGAAFLDVSTASTAHTICDQPDPWTAGQNLPPGATVQYHPLPAEGQAVSRLVLQAL